MTGSLFRTSARYILIIPELTLSHVLTWGCRGEIQAEFERLCLRQRCRRASVSAIGGRLFLSNPTKWN